MRHERATEEVRELAALYAMGSLTQHEARSLDFHIQEGCPICEEEIRRFKKAAARIGLAASEASAPEYIRDLLSARIDREHQTSPPAPPKTQTIEQKKVQEPPRPIPTPAPLFSDSRRQRPRLAPWALVAVLVVLGLMAAYAWNSGKETNTQLQAKVSALTADVEDLRAKLNAEKHNAGNLEQIASVVGKPGTRLSRLVVQTTSPASSAAVIWDTERGECLILGNFPPAPQGKKYQLWFFTPASRVSAGSFRIDSGGRTFEMIPVPLDAANASAAVITLEPDNGSQIPTSPYYAVGRID